jgi:hypothetical protein
MLIERSPDLGQALAGLAVLLAILVIHVPLARRALADLARDDVGVRTGTKRSWFLVIVLAGIVGPLAWFQYGRDARR